MGGSRRGAWPVLDLPWEVPHPLALHLKCSLRAASLFCSPFWCHLALPLRGWHIRPEPWSCLNCISASQWTWGKEGEFSAPLGNEGTRTQRESFGLKQVRELNWAAA